MSNPEKTAMRIGQLGRRKKTFVWDEDISAFESEEFTSENLLAGCEYTKGIQTKYFDHMCLSDRDYSTSSESEALDDSEDSSSSDFGSSSSSDDEAAPSTSKKDERSSGEDISVISEDSLIKSDHESSPLRSTVSSISIEWEPGARASTKMAVTYDAAMRQAAKSGINLSDILFDARKTNELASMVLAQKMALYEEDLSEQFTGKKREDVESETTHRSTYWKMRKIIKFLKMADVAGTNIALSALLSCDLEDMRNHDAIDDTGCIEILINLLGVEYTECRLLAFEVLDKITEVNEDISDLCLSVGLPEELVNNLKSADNREILACVKLMCNLMTKTRSRTVFRRAGVLSLLFQLVHRVSADVWHKKMSDVLDEHHLLYECGLGAIYILMSLMKSPLIREEMHSLGYVTIIIPLLTSKDKFVVKATMESVAKCASLEKYRLRFEISNLTKTVLRYWQPHTELVCRYLFKMAYGIESRKQIVEFDGLNKLMNFIKDDANIREQPYAFKYALSTLHRMGAYEKARDIIHETNLIETLFKILTQGHNSYKTSVAGILSYLSTYPDNWKLFAEVGRLSYVIELAMVTMLNANLLVYCLKIMSDLAYSSHAEEIFAGYSDTLPFLLTLFKNDNGMVVRCAARAIVPLTRFFPEFADEVKCENDSIDALMERLDHHEESVKAAVCDALSAIAVEDSILRTYSDMGLTRRIIPLIETENDELRESLCLLISTCSGNSTMRSKLGQRDVINRIANLLSSPNTYVAIAAASALLRMGRDVETLASMMSPVTVQALIKCSTSDCQDLSNAAVGCLENIKIAAYDAETSGEPRNSNVVAQVPKWEFPIQFKPSVIFHYDLEL